MESQDKTPASTIRTPTALAAGPAIQAPPKSHDRTARRAPDVHLGDVLKTLQASRPTKDLRTIARLPPLASHERLACVIAKSQSALTQQLGERYTPARASLEVFTLYDPKGEQSAALDRVRGFIANMEAVLRETRGLVLYGPSGVGKDHLLAAVLYHVASAGIPVGWVSGEDVFLKIRDSMDSGEREEKIIQHWLRPTVLGISDPASPRGELKDWDARILARLIDR